MLLEHVYFADQSRIFILRIIQFSRRLYQITPYPHVWCYFFIFVVMLLLYQCFTLFVLYLLYFSI
jgi:hypothetical protein